MIRTAPLIVMHQWGLGTHIEYWWSAFEPTGQPSRTWYEPVEDEV